MPVAEVRRSLAFIRKSWDEQRSDDKRQPLYLCDPVVLRSGTGRRVVSVERFALDFVLAHHTRRLTAKIEGGRDNDGEHRGNAHDKTRRVLVSSRGLAGDAGLATARAGDVSLRLKCGATQRRSRRLSCQFGFPAKPVSQPETEFVVLCFIPMTYCALAHIRSRLTEKERLQSV